MPAIPHHPVCCCMSPSGSHWKNQRLSLSERRCKAQWQQSFFFPSASSGAAVSHKIINIMRYHEKVAEWTCTAFHNTRRRRQQWNRVAAASHHARKWCSSLSDNILKTKNRKCFKSSAKNWRRKGSFKTLNSTDMHATSISGNPSEVAEVRRTHWEKNHFQNRPYTLSAVTYHKFLWREDVGQSDLGRPFSCSCPCLGLRHKFCSTCCTSAWKRPHCTGVIFPVNTYEQQQ